VNKEILVSFLPKGPVLLFLAVTHRRIRYTARGNARPASEPRRTEIVALTVRGRFCDLWGAPFAAIGLTADSLQPGAFEQRVFMGD